MQGARKRFFKRKFAFAWTWVWLIRDMRHRGARVMQFSCRCASIHLDYRHGKDICVTVGTFPSWWVFCSNSEYTEVSLCEKTVHTANLVVKNYSNYAFTLHSCFCNPFTPIHSLVSDRNRIPVVMAKRGGSCVHFSGITTCRRTSRETASHP